MWTEHTWLGCGNSNNIIWVYKTTYKRETKFYLSELVYGLDATLPMNFVLLYLMHFTHLTTKRWKLNKRKVGISKQIGWKCTICGIQPKPNEEMPKRMAWKI